MAGPIGYGVVAGMTIKGVTCPHCGVKMARARVFSGNVTCRTCGREFEVRHRTAPRNTGKRRAR
jgi:uncharacterized Zn finger protein (UPF0148 family)